MQQVNQKTHQRAASGSAKRVGVTSASGFIGQALLIEPARSGYQASRLEAEAYLSRFAYSSADQRSSAKEDRI